MTLEEAIKEVFYWQYNQGTTNFNTQLIRLFRKADKNNYAKLASVYPEMAQALEMWESAGDNGDELFEKMNLFKDLKSST